MTTKAMVIGLDGMPRTLLTRLADTGVTPHLGALLDIGHCAQLVAPVPEISSTSWASFLTGVNPGRHGIFGFTDLGSTGYDQRFPNLSDLASPPLWEYVAQAGLRTVCINVPGTYPAPAIDGALVSGFVAPRFEQAVSPPELIEVLRGLEYELDAEVGDVADDPAGFVARASRAMLARTSATEHLLRTQAWDVAVVVLTETDRVHHFLWRAVADPQDPLHPAVLDFYRLMDDCVARIAACVDSGDELFLVSDHGFGPADCQFYVNGWLRGEGLLAGLDSTPTLDRLDQRSVCFALDPARIYLHRQDRFTRGGLSVAMAEALAVEIADQLLDLRFDGEQVAPDIDGIPLVAQVHHAAAVYHGDQAYRSPDLIAVPAPGVQLRGAWGGDAVVRPDVLTGTHTRANAIFYRRGAVAATSSIAGVELLDMVDVLPTVLASLGIAAPKLDGVPSLRTPAELHSADPLLSRSS